MKIKESTLCVRLIGRDGQGCKSYGQTSVLSKQSSKKRRTKKVPSQQPHRPSQSIFNTSSTAAPRSRSHSSPQTDSIAHGTLRPPHALHLRSAAAACSSSGGATRASTPRLPRSCYYPYWHSHGAADATRASECENLDTGKAAVPGPENRGTGVTAGTGGLACTEATVAEGSGSAAAAGVH